MPQPTTDALLEKAKSGEKLSNDDRRRVLSYVSLVNPELSNYDLGEMFQVSEATIRRDKATIRQQLAEDVRDEDVGLVVGDIASNFKRQLRDLEKSKASCRPGTTEYRLHCTAIFELEKQKTKVLQDLGWYPKNLGNMTLESFEYAAIVLKDGSVETRPLTMFDEETQRQLRERTMKGLPPPQIAEAEYVDAPAQRAVVYTANGSEASVPEVQSPKAD